ncbi:hypothetical protein PGB90_000760 [Kerria lacca]
MPLCQIENIDKFTIIKSRSNLLNVVVIFYYKYSLSFSSLSCVSYHKIVKYVIFLSSL